MNERRLVVDASPLIFLAQIDALTLLRQLAVEVFLPSAVLREVLAGQELPPGLARLESEEWLRIYPEVALPEAIAGWDLGAGESQVLALAASPGRQAVVDDLQARRCARSLGIPSTGTLGILVSAKKAGLIPAARPLVEILLQSKLYLSRDLVEAVLSDIGE